ncbi:glycosyltransferase family 2 protein [Flavobacterium columnare]|uniref:Glycosyltransferase family 2 protein n=1 Tax=Flavobacterium columnare TaxID=996 RepID=A0AA94JPT6_9FLAO|nr:glycosyltransferase family 2 protein [Flavobacterium columnare]MCH4829007.1 glycosyltransferase family 2 protein [Flavobacterium columnare]MCH4833781.1 glycosyltransferase family 2 protein [Flavobacterium columnare]
MRNDKTAIIIPYYNARKHIIDVVSQIPDFIDALIIVDDKSPDVFPEKLVLENLNNQVKFVYLKNDRNLGVGGATIHGFLYAIKNDFQIVIKVDADNQMDLKYLPDLIEPLKKGKIQMAKGNRFRDIKALSKMPFARRIGNLMLSFITKMATGYWNNFDPTNGYFAIQINTLKKINFNNLSNRYFFETSLLSEMYFTGAKIKDISMPAIYANEKSQMQLWKIPFEFSFKLMKLFIKRIVKQYFLYDFNIGSVYLFFGVPLFFFGITYGVYNWIYYYFKKMLAPTGTIMIITLSIILGFQMLLQAIQFDISQAPKANEEN